MSNAQYLASLVNSSGNINIPVSNAGVVFNNSSATTNSTLNDYETGTWTVTDVSGAGLTFTNTTAQYTKIGTLVFFSFDITFPSTASTANIAISLPFTSMASPVSPGGGAQTYSPVGLFEWYVGTNQSYIHVYTTAGVGATNVAFSGKECAVSGCYKASF